MNSQKIVEFSNFLSSEPKSYSEISKFLVMNTFSAEKIACIYIAEVIETGEICLIGGFGWTSEEYEAIEIRSVMSKYPLNVALQTQSVKIIKFDEGFTSEYPLLKNFKVHDNWVTQVSISANPLGGISFFSTIDIALTEELDIFLSAIGALLGLYGSRLPVSLVEVALEAKNLIIHPVLPLTDRQLVIASMLERGFNNGKISEEIGYSESLVRQETVLIYKKLRVSGRVEMRELKAHG